jgi:3-hydroxyacyl-CoA dehydrogenase
MIKTAAVLGAGVMGTQIAELLSNSGLQVLLLSMRNRNNFKTSSFQTGNFEKNLHNLQDVDWIIEAVSEELEIKQELFKKIASLRKKEAIVSTNTSGIPISEISKNFNENFLNYFLGTHFFNPLKYLPLLEIIPGNKTLPSVVQMICETADSVLHRIPLICKDTPGFVANRIGIFMVGLTVQTGIEYQLKVEEVDEITGQIIGRPKSATFRTLDLVGIDHYIHVSQYLYESLFNDPMRKYFKVPYFMLQMLENQKKSGKHREGFYKKITGKTGKPEMYSLDLKTFQYTPCLSPQFPSLEKAKEQTTLEKGIQVLAEGTDKASDFFKETMKSLIKYAASKIPEIVDSKISLDQAVKSGFGWKLGPFELWEKLYSLSPHRF